MLLISLGHHIAEHVPRLIEVGVVLIRLVPTPRIQSVDCGLVPSRLGLSLECLHSRSSFRLTFLPSSRQPSFRCYITRRQAVYEHQRRRYRLRLPDEYDENLVHVTPNEK